MRSGESGAVAGRCPAFVPAFLSTLALIATAMAWVASASASPAPEKITRYSLAGGCYGLRSESAGQFVAKAGGGYSAGAGSVGEAEPFRMQATDLGKYLFYGAEKDFLAIGLLEMIGPAATPSPAADWTIDSEGGAFTIFNQNAGKSLAVGGGGDLVLANDPGLFSFERASGCPKYPEIEVNVHGGPVKGRPRYGEVSGMLEGHLHGMAFEFLGGRAHCGKPWDPYGAPFALVDCPDHQPNGQGAVLEDVVSYGGPSGGHDTHGWPTFVGWPHHASLTHEQTYYRWLERAWRGGLRVFVNLNVENRALCEAYPLKKNSCNEMDSVLLQAHDMEKMQDYIDAQAGGPGRGFYRIVRNPFAARKVINDGKLAVIMGMEVSEPFGCLLLNGEPQCTYEQIADWIDRLHKLGVRQLEIVNKFDNALTGVAGDGGSTGVVTNTGNFLTTGRFWDLETCPDPENTDNSPTAVEHNDDAIIGNGLEALLPPGAVPVYPPPPWCNRLALSSRGEFAIRDIMRHKMIFDPDHMSVYARDQALNLLESKHYSGVISSHSWSTPSTLPRIYKLGGVITPYAGSSEGFVDQWRTITDEDKSKLGKQYFGFGYGADMNGFGHQGGPRGADVPNPVTYPFKTLDGKVTIDQQQSGTRTYDINTDGVAHYGLYPDWVQDLRMIAGDRIVKDMNRGAEAYLQMWERASGVERVRCPTWHGSFSGQGFGSRLRLGASPRSTLFRAGQPVDRTRTWKWCTRNTKSEKRALGGRRNIIGVFDGDSRLGFAASTLQRNDAHGVGRGDPIAAVRAIAQPSGSGLWVRDAGDGSTFVWGTGTDKVRFSGVVTDAIGRDPGALRSYVSRAGLG